jgi:hypothetical protein
MYEKADAIIARHIDRERAKAKAAGRPDPFGPWTLKGHDRFRDFSRSLTELVRQ